MSNNKYDKKPVFVQGIAFVQRNRKYGAIMVGGKEIIPPRYDAVMLLSNDTINVRREECYGVFDLKGNHIFPPIFTSIKYITKDRIRVAWDSHTIEPWSNTCHIKIDSNEEYCGLTSDRSTLCNASGERIIDKTFLYIGTFIDKHERQSIYAKAYKEVIRDNTYIKLKQVGVVDINGNVIIDPIYDRIVLYGNSYASLRKDGKYGIANLTTKEVKIFNNLNIKHLWDVNNNGIAVFSEDCEYNISCDDWVGGTRGVVNMEGVLVPSGTYQDILFCENGMIKVFYEKKYGLLDEKGKEILPPKYVYISNFIGDYAIICIRYGEWWIINKTGKFVKECKYNEKELLEQICTTEDYYEKTEDIMQIIFHQFDEVEIDERDLEEILTKKYEGIDLDELHSLFYENYYDEELSNESDLIDFDYKWYLDQQRSISVVIYDAIPKKANDSYYTESQDWCNNDGYSKYGGYNDWDDFTIDEAFDGNPELTWNID